MSYSKIGPFVDGGPPYLSAADLNRLEQGVIDANRTIAPPPSGGDDTAALQALVTAAQNGGGTLTLQPGTYKANLTTSKLFQQPLIVGQGRYMTSLQPFDTTKPVVKFIGTSGSLAGGGLQHLQLKAVTTGVGVGVEYAGCCGVDSTDVDIQNFAEGVRFHNELAHDFTEFCTVQGSIEGCTLAVRYMRDAGDESFHGSGLTGNTIVNLPTSGATNAVQIDSGAFPYNAPMSATFMQGTLGTPPQTAFLNNNPNRVASFYGNLRSEGVSTIADNAGSTIWYAGSFSSVSASNLSKLGKLYLVDKAYFGGSNLGPFAQFKPYQKTVTLAAGMTALTTEAPHTSMIQVDILASNYHYAYLLHCWENPYTSGGGTVTVLANPESLNGAGYGAPVFAWSNYNLAVTNANYSSAVKAYVAVAPMTATLDADRPSQN